ncbi:MAG: hypothetical protein KAT09_04235, partial [Candidatus Aegiribacteria sp.]|nr:hypothetical protein [Candidatus Aegiribacteria sp.]
LAAGGDAAAAASVLNVMEDVQISSMVYSEVLAVTIREEEDYMDLVTGDWGLNFNLCVNMGMEEGLSPSGRYFASGADGTDVNRGPVYIFDLQTGQKYTTWQSINSNSRWIHGDFMLIEAVASPEADTRSGISDMPWINYSCFCGDGFETRDIVLLRENRAWLVLPEDQYYNYRLESDCGIESDMLYFDVVASLNVVPAVLGLETTNDFLTWIDSMGGYNDAFPSFVFRVYVDTLTMSLDRIERRDD